VRIAWLGAWALVAASLPHAFANPDASAEVAKSSDEFAKLSPQSQSSVAASMLKKDFDGISIASETASAQELCGRITSCPA